MLYKLVQICTILSKLLKTYKKFCTIFKIMFITNCIILYNIVGVVQLNTQRPPARPPPPPPASAAAARTAAAAAVRETARPRRPMTRMVGPGASDRRLSAALLLPLRRRLGPPPPPSRPRRPPARERLEAGNLFRYIYIYIYIYIYWAWIRAVPQCPFKFGALGPAPRPFGSTGSPKPLQFQIEMPIVARAQFEPS